MTVLNNSLNNSQTVRRGAERASWLRTAAADAALFTCALLWGVGFVAMKNGLSVYPTFWLLFLRFGGASLVMGVFFFRRVAACSRDDLKGGFVIGVFLFLAMAFQTLGLNYTTAGKQSILTACYVVLVPFLTWGLRRVFPGWISIAGAVICFSGMGLLTSDVSGPVNRGDVLTVAAAFLFAGQIISTASYTAVRDPLRLTFVQFAVSAALSFCAGLMFDGPFAFRGMEGLPEAAYLILVCTFICFILQNVGQKYTLPTHASILMGLESVFGALSSVILLGEIFTFRMIVGCVLAVGAVFFVELAPALSRFLRSPAKAPSRPACRQ